MLAFVQLDNQPALHSYGTTGKQNLPIIQGWVAHVQVRRVSPTWNHSSDRMVLQYPGLPYSTHYIRRINLEETFVCTGGTPCDATRLLRVKLVHCFRAFHDLCKACQGCHRGRKKRTLWPTREISSIQSFETEVDPNEENGPTPLSAAWRPPQNR